MKLDILVFSVHPDDAELGCSGTILSHIAMGKKVGVVDLTQGELGTRGNAELRLQEADDASEILKLSARENLGFRDGFFTIDEDHLLSVIRIIRKFQPEIVIANAIEDRHPDHGRASDLVAEASFLSGLRKIKTSLDGESQAAWRPRKVYNFIQDRYIKPDLIVDISDFWDEKVKSILAYKSQFYNPENDEPETYISSPEFLKFVEARAMEYGHYIGVKYGEGFTCRQRVGVKNLFDLL
ncbi:bacillithiol biosynthesis deacetylase BshB1 [Cytophagaceae bacterium ABcell3]|nr:bacillithiol biosynthesis deacetylase BshB1 [Cytophagaceae bacterium ABcell3]